MPQDEALRVELIEDLTALQSVEQEWTALWRQDARATPFQSADWLIPWAKAFGADRLLTIALRRRSPPRTDSLAALVPLYLYTDPATGERQLLLLGAGTSDYLDCVTAPGTGSEIVAEVNRQLRAKSDAWDVGYFEQLRTGSPLLCLEAEPRITNAEPCPRILLGDEHSLPAKLKRSIAYYRRRAEALGELRFVRASSPAEALDAFELLVALHSRRWEMLGEAGVLSDPHVLAHHREAIPLLQESDTLHLYSLQLSGRTIGVIYALADHPGAKSRSFYYYISGFDPEFHTLSPGTLLLAGLVEAAKAAGAEAVDLLRGEEAYKKLWGARPVETYAVRWQASQCRTEGDSRVA